MVRAVTTAFRFEHLGEAPAAVVAAVHLPGMTAEELDSSLGELERLATTLGLRPVGRVVQRRAKLAAGKVFGDGKLQQLAAWTGGDGVIEGYVRPGSRQARERDAAELDAEAAEALVDDDLDGEPEAPEPSEPDDADADAAPTERAQVVLIDHELSPTQQRNLEKACGVDVLDRTSVILEIFQRHARTREARMQVEIARLKYLAPRLREGGGGGDRVRGGVGCGAGATGMGIWAELPADRRGITMTRHELASSTSTPMS